MEWRLEFVGDAEMRYVVGVLVLFTPFEGDGCWDRNTGSRDESFLG